jgi:hypothetical protein
MGGRTALAVRVCACPESSPTRKQQLSKDSEVLGSYASITVLGPGPGLGAGGGGGRRHTRYVRQAGTGRPGRRRPPRPGRPARDSDGRHDGRKSGPDFRPGNHASEPARQAAGESAAARPAAAGRRPALWTDTDSDATDARLGLRRQGPQRSCIESFPFEFTSGNLNRRGMIAGRGDGRARVSVPRPHKATRSRWPGG